MRVIKNNFLQKVLSIPKSIELMESALAAKAQGKVKEPQRTIVDPSTSAGKMFVMPSYIEHNAAEAYYGLKALTVFKENSHQGLRARNGVMLLFCGQTGGVLAIIEAELLTYYRTAAVSALATQILARKNAQALAIIGTGQQAQYHLRAIAAVRDLQQVFIAGRSVAKATAMAEQMQAEFDFLIQPARNAEEAVQAADIIVTATSSTQAVIDYKWLKAGVHINSIGAVKPNAREIDDNTLKASKLFVDSIGSFITETGDYLLPLAKGIITRKHIVSTLGELLIEPGLLSRKASDITLFKSLGLPVEDLVIAQYIYQEALASGAGDIINF